MLNYIWAVMIFIGILYAMLTGNIDKITEDAIEQLEEYGEKAEFLKQLALYIRDRNK